MVEDIVNGIKDVAMWVITKIVEFIISLFQPLIDGMIDKIIALLPVNLSDDIGEIAADFLDYYDFFAYYIPFPYAFQLLVAYFNFLSLFWIYKKSMSFFGMVDATKINPA